MKHRWQVVAALVVAFCTGGLALITRAQAPPAPQAPVVAPGGQRAGGAPAGRGSTARKRILILGPTYGFRHDSITDAMGTIWRMGRDSGLWDAEMRSDLDLIRRGTKPSGGIAGQSLDNFDALVLVSTTGDMPLTDQQKADLLGFVHDDGKGLVGVHAALDANYKWPEYAEMLGGWFDGHPWNTFDAPVIVEDPAFPAMRHFAKEFRTVDEMYQAKSWSRDKVNVLMRLDETQLDYTNKPNTRADRDFALAWSKMYGKGRVFYSTLGHTRESWQDPAVQTMYAEAIKWVLRRTEGSALTHPKPTK